MNSVDASPRAAGSSPRLGLRALLNAFTAAALGAAIVIGGISLWIHIQVARTAGQTFVAKDVTADVLPPPMYLIEMRLVLSQTIEGTLSPAQGREAFKRLKDEYEGRVNYWKAHPPYGLERHLLGTQHVAALAFIAAASNVLAAVAAGEDAAAIHAALQAAHREYLAHRGGVDATVKESVVFADTAIKTFETRGRLQLWLQAILVVLTTLVLAGFGMWIRRSIWAAVGGEPVAAAAVARQVASGDLTVRVSSAGVDGSSIMAALLDMSQALTRMVVQVRGSSESIAANTREIAAGNEDLSRRTERQAATLEETSSSMEELGAAVRQNTENVRQANASAADASRLAEKGGEVVGQLIGTMKSIDQSSRQIVGIINLIDSIAFQTNILALNAAVEAARAGDQGRGFAVVASEVRILAGRSAEAAREIKALIGSSVERVAQGAEYADKAGATMAEVVESIRRVSDIVSGISAANASQNASMSQIGNAIAEIDQGTQHNAALVRQSAEAAASLNALAQRLVSVVAQFKLDAAARTASGIAEPVPHAAVAPARRLPPAAPLH